MAAVLLDMRRKAFDLLSRRYLRCVLRVVFGQDPDIHAEDLANDCDAVTWILLLLGSSALLELRLPRTPGPALDRLELGRLRIAPSIRFFFK